MGTRLLVPEHQLNAIQAAHAYSPNHLQDCLNSMFAFWLNNCPEPTCELLIQAVDVMGRRDVVTMLCEKYYGELVAKHGQRGFEIILQLEVLVSFISFVYIYAHLQFAYGILH